MSESEVSQQQRNQRPTVIGKVVSDKMQKTIIVRRDQKVLHPLYKKYVKRSSKFVAHDAEDTARVGDVVELAQTRPLSRTKRWRLVSVLRRAPSGVAPAAASKTAAAAAPETASETASEEVSS